MKNKLLYISATMCFTLFNVANADDNFLCLHNERANKYADAIHYCNLACNLNNNGNLCALLGALYYEQLHDYTRSIRAYEKSCYLKSSMGCFNLAMFYYSGDGVRQNKSIAKEYFGRACDYGLQTGCNNYRDLSKKGY